MNSATPVNSLMQMLSLGTGGVSANIGGNTEYTGHTDFASLLEGFASLTESIEDVSDLDVSVSGQSLPLSMSEAANKLSALISSFSQSDIEALKQSIETGEIDLPESIFHQVHALFQNDTAEIPALSNENLIIDVETNGTDKDTADEGVAIRGFMTSVLNHYFTNDVEASGALRQGTAQALVAERPMQSTMQTSIQTELRQLLQSQSGNDIESMGVDNLKQSEFLELLSSGDEVEFDTLPAGKSLLDLSRHHLKLDLTQGGQAASNTATLSYTPSSMSTLVGESTAGLGFEELGLHEIEQDDMNTYEQIRDRIQLGKDKSEWGAQLGSRIISMVSGEIQQAKIHLDPPELGSLEIKLQVTQDQVTAQVQAQSPQVRDVLEASAHRLRETLQSQGLELAGFDVGSESSNQSMGEQNQGSDHAEMVTSLEVSEEGQHAEASMTQKTIGLLDTFA